MKTLSNNNILALTNMKYAINNGIFRHPKIENPVKGRFMSQREGGAE